MAACGPGFRTGESMIHSIKSMIHRPDDVCRVGRVNSLLRYFRDQGDRGYRQT